MVAFQTTNLCWLVPAYKPWADTAQGSPLTHQGVARSGAVSALQDCFKCTALVKMFKTATNINIEEHAEAAMSHVAKCTKDVREMKTRVVRNNQNPRMTAEVRQL